MEDYPVLGVAVWYKVRAEGRSAMLLPLQRALGLGMPPPTCKVAEK